MGNWFSFLSGNRLGRFPIGPSKLMKESTRFERRRRHLSSSLIKHGKLIGALTVCLILTIAAPGFMPTVSSGSSGEIPALCQVYQEYFPIGAAVNYRTLKSHQSLLMKHFNSITAENEMKFENLQFLEGYYDFDQADAIVNFAKGNNIKVRGHTLVWHNQTPQWVFNDKSWNEASKELLLQRMKEHITTVVTRYKGSVYAWDVVNEAIADDAAFYRDSPWYRIIGPEYIEYAFRYAHEADPEAELYYNDYNAVYPDKCDKIYRLLKGLKEKGIPVHGVGIQGHWDINSPSLDEVEAAIRKYASLGLKVQITELDLSLYAWGDNRKLSEPGEGLLEKQAQRYRDLFSLFRKYKDVITGVTFWGVADDSTWKDDFPVRGRKDWPLLFDVNHQPKKAFRAIIDF